jgi:hypothetical protein
MTTKIVMMKRFLSLKLIFNRGLRPSPKLRGLRPPPIFESQTYFRFLSLMWRFVPHESLSPLTIARKLICALALQFLSLKLIFDFFKSLKFFFSKTYLRASAARSASIFESQFYLRASTARSASIFAQLQKLAFNFSKIYYSLQTCFTLTGHTYIFRPASVKHACNR